MSVTNYSTPDLENIQVLASSFSGCTDLGTAPYINIIGFIGTPGFSAASPASYSEGMGGQIIYQADINHADVLNPIPTNAKITLVDMYIHIEGEGNSSITASYASGTGRQVANTTLHALVVPLTAGDGTIPPLVETIINQTDSHISAVPTTGDTQSCSTTVSPTILHITFDFTLNPGGLFPLGYMTYADYLVNFAQVLFNYFQFDAGVSANRQTGTGTITGSDSVGLSFTTTLWNMDVTWEVPLTWTIDTPTITLPDNIFQISRPTAPANLQDDVENIESVIVDGHEIFPDDPWVIVWTRVKIRFHLPPDDVPPTPDTRDITVEITFGGTVPLGTISIVPANLSGIYFFDEDTHHDQLYARTTTSTTVTTQSVAIPAPMLVTSFFDNDETEVMHYTGIRMRVIGAGTLKCVLNSLDYVNTEDLADLTLQSVNNVNPFLLANFIDQAAAVRMHMDALDDHLNLSKLVIFTKSVATGYPQ